jgi:hypothetical protein
MKRCYAPTAGAAGSGREKKGQEACHRRPIALGFRPPNRNASASWPQSKTNAASVLGSMKPAFN